MTQPAGQEPHKPADDREEVYFVGSPLLRGEIGKFLLWLVAGLVIAVGVPVVASITDHPLPILAIAILAIVGLLFVIVPVILLKATRYRISNYRIDFERGLLSKTIDTLELWHVEDISLHQSLLDRILRVGTITVVSHDDTTPNLKLEGLPTPRPLFESLKQRIIAVKRQRGVIKMDTGD